MQAKTMESLWTIKTIILSLDFNPFICFKEENVVICLKNGIEEEIIYLFRERNRRSHF